MIIAVPPAFPPQQVSLMKPANHAYNNHKFNTHIKVMNRMNDNHHDIDASNDHHNHDNNNNDRSNNNDTILTIIVSYPTGAAHYGRWQRGGFRV